MTETHRYRADGFRTALEMLGDLWEAETDYALRARQVRTPSWWRRKYPSVGHVYDVLSAAPALEAA